MSYDDLLAEMAKPKKKHNQNPPSNTASLAQLRREQSDRWHEEERERQTCRCRTPIEDRKYLGRMACKCGKFIP